MNDGGWAKGWVLGRWRPVEAGRRDRIHRDGVVVFAVARQRAKGGVVDVALWGRPAICRVHHLQLFLARPVPDFDCVAKPDDDGDQAACLGEDHVAGDKEVTGTLLHLDVEACLECCLEGAAGDDLW